MIPPTEAAPGNQSDRVHVFPPMIDLPRVNPVGVTEIPAAFSQNPRRHSPLMRLFAGALVAIFTSVVLVTGAMSLASWCLTSDAGAPFPF